MIYHPNLHEIAFAANVNASDIHILPPQALLADFIARHAIIQNPKPTQTNAPWLMPPDASAHLVLHFIQSRQNDFSVRFSIVGPRSKAIQINRKHRQLTIITTFKPAGIYPFLQHLTPELRNTSLPVQELWQNEFEQMKVPLKQAIQLGKLEKCIELIEYFLLQKVQDKNALHPVTRQFTKIIKKQQDKKRINLIAREIGVSDRFLRSIVKEQTGLSPKTLLKIQRLTHSFHLWQDVKRQGWAAVATEAGYFDQSHMIDEYQAMLGFSPGQIDF